MSHKISDVLRKKDEARRTIKDLSEAKTQLCKLSGNVMVEELKGYGHRAKLPVFVVAAALDAAIDEANQQLEQCQAQIDIMTKALEQFDKKDGEATDA